MHMTEIKPYNLFGSLKGLGILYRIRDKKLENMMTVTKFLFVFFNILR